MTRKVVKESEIADHLSNHTVEHYEPLNFDLPDKDVPVTRMTMRRVIGGPFTLMEQ
jgi:hypothetical protein